jgi:U3 small nucleolar RNA-associated protein 25
LREFADPEAEMDDDFKLGISINNKNIKLYAPFSNCDIILASPLGLKLVTGVKGEKTADYSFLTSLEVLVVDRASTINMQNWQTLKDILQLCNLMPKHQDVNNALDTIRPYFFEN